MKIILFLTFSLLILWARGGVPTHRYSALIIGFEQPLEVKRIFCIPRGDRNGVYPGNTYELRYFDPDGWHSLGALYWLGNLTTGAEERIFTWQDGLRRFW